MASQTGISSTVELLGDLPSKRLLGKGVASIGYETEVKGERFARKDFIGVPSGLFEKEAAVLVELEDHKNIVKTLGWTVDKTSCSLVVEYVDENLLGLLRKRKQSSDLPGQPFELPEAVDIMLQIASGMEYLHDRGILHGHLKTKNILVNHGDQSNSLSVKVADFGLVRTKRKSMPFVSRQARKRDMVRWKAPEILEAELLVSKDRDETSSESDSDESTVGSLSPVISWRELSADVYSFALICSQILTGEDPYPNDLNWKEWGVDIVAGEVRPTLPAGCPPELRTLLNSCWGMMPPESSSVRPTFSYIRRALEQLVALPVRTHSYSSIYDDPADEVMVVTALINTVIDLTRTERRTRSCEDLENLREQLEVIQVDVVKIEVQLWVLRKKILYMVEQSAYSINCFSEEQDIVRMVEAWLKSLQHALNLTASELRSAHPGTMSHFLLHLESFDSTFLMHMKILEHTKEINELAKNREVLALQLKNLLSCYNFGRLQNSERHGQFLLIHQTPSFVFLETLFGLLNARDQEILKEQFRRVLHPIGLRRSMESKLHEKAISGRSTYGSLPDLPTYASSGRPYSVDRSSYASSSGRPHSVDPSSMKHQANQFLSQDFEHPARETPSSSLEFHTSTTAGMGAPHDIRQAMMLDEVEQDPSWLHMEMDASPETGNAIMQDSAIMQQSILSSLTFQGEPVQLLQQATSSRTLHFNPFKEWRRAHVVPRRSEGSTRQWLLHRCFEFLRHISRVEAQAGSSVQQSFAPRPRSSASSKLLPFAPDEQSFGLSAPRMESISSFNLPPMAPDKAIKLRPSSWQKRPREGASIGTPGHPDYDRAAESYNAQERRRRIKQNEELSALQELLPIISKSDKVTIIGNAIIHLKNLQKEIDALEANTAELTSQNENLKLSNQRLQEKNKQLEAMVSGTGPVLNP